MRDQLYYLQLYHKYKYYIMICLTYALTSKSVQWKEYIDIDIKTLDDIYR